MLSLGLTIPRISTDKHVIIIAQDVATYKVMDLFDVRCKGSICNWGPETDLGLSLSRDSDGREPDGYPTRGRTRLSRSPEESVC